MGNFEPEGRFDFQSAGKAVLKTEREGLDQLDQYINDDFTRACEKMFACVGKIVVMGMGKSGHVGRKMAATFASTGTPAFFVHPGEASHGDLGMVSKQDIVILISNSGESHEILALIPVLKRLAITMICLTANQESSMGKAADVHVCVRVPQEACPLGLAPTTSTTAAMVMGDAMAVALLQARGFTAEDLPCRTLAEHWVASFCCGSAISCTAVPKSHTSAATRHCAMHCWRSPAKTWG